MATRPWCQRVSRPEAPHPGQAGGLPAAIRRLQEAAKGGDQSRQTERPRHKPVLSGVEGPVVFKIPQVHVFHHQRPGHPVVHKEAVGTVYRLRWQVELVFKSWKSLFQINVLKGTRPERILCLIYSRLTVILVVQRLLALASDQAVAEQRELSFCKATQWLMRGGRLLKAFIDRQFGGLLRRMVSRLNKLFKQKRKRLTTWQLIAQQVVYLDSFADLGHFVREELAQGWLRLA
jgi:Transposase DDE domain